MKKTLSLLLALLMLFSMSAVALAEGEPWICSNGHENPSVNQFCGKCGEAKPEEEEPWICSNGHENPSNNTFCTTCGEKRPVDIGEQLWKEPFENEEYETALPLVQEAADQGDVEAIAALALYEIYGYVAEPDYEKGLDLARQAADAGNARGMFLVGRCYDRGNSVIQDYKKAAEWYQKAANLGDSWAMCNLGSLYFNGEGVTQDYQKAKELLEEAADLGNEDAIGGLGVLYYYGDGVTQNYQKAKELWEEAADLGNAAAMSYLGAFYYNGDGVEQDYKKAMEWFKKAAALDDSWSMWRIGDLYYDGNGVSYDFETALSWWHKAADLEAESADQAYEKLVEAYKDQNYIKSYSFYEKAKDYKDANKYANLLKARLCYELDLNDAQIESLEKEIVKDISFEDAADVLVCNISIAESYISGQWFANGGYYFKVVNSISETNLPDEPYTGKNYYNIYEGTYYEYNDWSDPNDRIAQLSFEPVSASEMNVYCFKNSKTYTFTKKS